MRLDCILYLVPENDYFNEETGDIDTRKKWYKWVHKRMIKRFSIFTIAAVIFSPAYQFFMSVLTNIVTHLIQVTIAEQQNYLHYFEMILYRCQVCWFLYLSLAVSQKPSQHKQLNLMSLDEFLMTSFLLRFKQSSMKTTHF